MWMRIFLKALFAIYHKAWRLYNIFSSARSLDRSMRLTIMHTHSHPNVVISLLVVVILRCHDGRHYFCSLLYGAYLVVLSLYRVKFDKDQEFTRRYARLISPHFFQRSRLGFLSVFTEASQLSECRSLVTTLKMFHLPKMGELHTSTLESLHRQNSSTGEACAFI